MLLPALAQEPKERETSRPAFTGPRHFSNLGPWLGCPHPGRHDRHLHNPTGRMGLIQDRREKCNPKASPAGIYSTPGMAAMMRTATAM